MRTALALLLALAHPACLASDIEVQRVAEGVYALVGEMDQRSPENLGNNATFGLVVTPAGAVLVDPGGSHRGAARLDAVIRTLTEQPVRVVINTGGQDHRWLGNGYFRARGARIVASRAAVDDQRARFRDQYNALASLIGEDALAGTEAVHAADPFDGTHAFELGGERFELHRVGPAHTPGDTLVWMPARRIAFAGDVVYVERLLGIGAQSNSRSWLAAFEVLAGLEPAHVIPGHGHATDMTRARAETGDYLAFLRDAVGRHLEAGRGMDSVGTIDQSRFAHLAVFDQLKGRNAQQVYQEMEFE